MVAIRVLTFVFSLAASTFLTVPAASAEEIAQVSRKEVRGVWLSFPWWDLKAEDQVKVAQYFAQQGVNKAYLSVYDNGKARWQSRALASAGLASSQSDGEFMASIQRLRDAGLEVAAFFEGGLSVFQDQAFFRDHPSWLQVCDGEPRSPEHGGNLLAFVDPRNSEALEPIYQSLEELARHPVGFTEIQLDRFRYSYNKTFHPCQSQNGESSPENINQVVKAAYTRIKAVRSDIQVTASPVASYGSWKHLQQWGRWIAGGYIDGIVSQAYIMPENLAACSPSYISKETDNIGLWLERRKSLAIFRGEIASVLGNQELLSSAVNELRILGADPDTILELNERRAMVEERHRQLEASPRKIPIAIGFTAEAKGDAGCMLDEMYLARELGIKDGVLWLSGVAPEGNGAPNPAIDDNLSLLKRTLWRH